MSKILKISEAASLAMHAIAVLAADSERQFATKEIADIISASENHLAKILQTLSKMKIVISIRGPKGGFKFNPSKKDITLLEIYETFDGKIDDHYCLFNLPVCNGNCILGDITKKVSDQIKDKLSKTKLSDIKLKMKLKNNKK